MEIHIRKRWVKCDCGCSRWLKIDTNRYTCERCESERPTNYYLEFWYSGKQRMLYSDERGRPIDSLARAKFLREDILYEIQKGVFNVNRYIKVKKVKTFPLLEEFYKEKSKTIAPSYISAYQTLVNEAKTFFGAKNVRELTKKDLLGYQKHLETTKPNIKPTTVKNYLALFKVFLNWCHERELVTIVPDLPVIYCEEPKTKWINEVDQRKILDVIPDEDKSIVRFSMLTGLRPGEIRALRVKDINQDNRTANVHATFSGLVYREQRKGRGAKQVVVPIHEEIWPYVQERCKSALPESFLFFDPKTGKEYSGQRWLKVWNQAKKKLGIEGISAYQATRHSFASQLSSKGVPIQVIKELLGHSSISMTTRYSHPSLDSMRTAISKLTLKEGEVVEFKKK